MVVILVLFLTLLAAIVFIFEMLVDSMEMDSERNTELRSAVFRALVNKADVKIADNACVINGDRLQPDGTFVNNDVTVGDFIASYLQWNMALTPAAHQQFGCSGSEILKCHWQFGQKKTFEGWDRILQFEYSAISNSIDTDSLKCLDIP